VTIITLGTANLPVECVELTEASGTNL